MSEASKKNRLEQAAEALVQAASMEVDTITQQKLAVNLDALKVSFDTKLNTVTQSVKASNENFDAKINTVNQHLANLQKEISGVKALLETQNKQQKLEMAMKLTNIGSFNYYDSAGRSNLTDSSNLVKLLLQWFALDYGYNLSEKHYIRSSYVYNVTEKERENFRTALVHQLTKLIGHKPRLVNNGDGKYAIYYS